LHKEALGCRLILSPPSMLETKALQIPKRRALPFAVGVSLEMRANLTSDQSMARRLFSGGLKHWMSDEAKLLMDYKGCA